MILHEQGYAHENIELQLAHTHRNAVSAAYAPDVKTRLKYAVPAIGSVSGL